MDHGVVHLKDLLRVVAVLCVAHGVVHILYVIPDPEGAMPEFSLETSWLVPAGAREPLGLAFVSLTLTAFALLGLAVWGMRGLRGRWRQLAAVGAVASLALLVAFPDARLLFAVLVDLALLAVVALRPSWTDAIGA